MSRSTNNHLYSIPFERRLRECYIRGWDQGMGMLGVVWGWECGDARGSKGKLCYPF